MINEGLNGWVVYFHSLRPSVPSDLPRGFLKPRRTSHTLIKDKHNMSIRSTHAGLKNNQLGTQSGVRPLGEEGWGKGEGGGEGTNYSV